MCAKPPDLQDRGSSKGSVTGLRLGVDAHMLPVEEGIYSEVERVPAVRQVEGGICAEPATEDHRIEIHSHIQVAQPQSVQLVLFQGGFEIETPTLGPSRSRQ